MCRILFPMPWGGISAPGSTAGAAARRPDGRAAAAPKPNSPAMELRRVIGVMVNLPVGALSFVKLGVSITAWNRPRNPAYTGYRRTGRDDRYHADAQIYPALGNIEVESLNPRPSSDGRPIWSFI